MKDWFTGRAIAISNSRVIDLTLDHLYIDKNEGKCNTHR